MAGAGPPAGWRLDSTGIAGGRVPPGGTRARETGGNVGGKIGSNIEGNIGSNIERNNGGKNGCKNGGIQDGSPRGRLPACMRWRTVPKQGCGLSRKTTAKARSPACRRSPFRPILQTARK